MKAKMQKKNTESGFTLIELMVVIVILGVLAGLIIPRVMGRPDEARQAKAKIQMESMETALKLYKLDSGNYPTTEQGLRALVEAPTVGALPRNWRAGGYLENALIEGHRLGVNIHAPAGATTVVRNCTLADNAALSLSVPSGKGLTVFNNTATGSPLAV